MPRLHLKQTIVSNVISNTTVSYTHLDVYKRQSHSIRSTVVSHTYDVTGLKKAQDITGDLEKHQLKKEYLQLENFISILKQNINPFNTVDAQSDLLYNIATGRAASQQVCDFLLDVERSGRRLRETFISECAASAIRFELPENKIKY